MQRVQTVIVWGVPLITTFTLWRFGRNRRLVTPVIFLPAPPFFLASPRRQMLLPATGFFPQIAQTLDITNSSDKVLNSVR